MNFRASLLLLGFFLLAVFSSAIVIVIGILFKIDEEYI